MIKKPKNVLKEPNMDVSTFDEIDEIINNLGEEEETPSMHVNIENLIREKSHLKELLHRYFMSIFNYRWPGRFSRNTGYRRCRKEDVKCHYSILIRAQIRRIVLRENYIPSLLDFLYKREKMLKKIVTLHQSIVCREKTTTITEKEYHDLYLYQEETELEEVLNYLNNLKKELVEYNYCIKFNLK